MSQEIYIVLAWFARMFKSQHLKGLFRLCGDTGKDFEKKGTLSSFGEARS